MPRLWRKRDRGTRRRALIDSSILSASFSPSAIRTASLTIGTPVTFDMNGTVRLPRGLTSITKTDEPPGSLTITI